MRDGTTGAPIRLPGPLRAPLEKALRRHLQTGDAKAAAGPQVDFTQPTNEPALLPADSVSWQVFKNPVALFIGGITAVLLELAEPRVRSGVWNHTTFRTDPLSRMRRTGLAAMVTVYGARSIAEPMVARVRQMHERIRGETPAGVPYHANDPVLLRWVHATAAFGFLEAYHSYVRPLSRAERDRYYAEGAPIARLYGAESPPRSEEELTDLFAAMQPQLEPSTVIMEFLRIMRRVRVLPFLSRPMNVFALRAAVAITPVPVQRVLKINGSHRLPPFARRLICTGGQLADRIVLDANPAVQASLRLGLPRDHLFRSAGSGTNSRTAS